MDVWSAIRTKRMVRRFAQRPLGADEINRIVDAGRHAASSKNQQRWDFVVVENRARLEALAKCGPFAGHVAGAAAAVGLITPDPRPQGSSTSIMWDLGLAAENMMLAAWELGIGSVPATVYEHDLARQILGYPETHHCEYILSFGYPAETAALSRPNKAGGRKPLSEMVHEERW